MVIDLSHNPSKMVTTIGVEESKETKETESRDPTQDKENINLENQMKTPKMKRNGGFVNLKENLQLFGFSSTP